jgi:phosphonate transport system ATP-binding protein
MALVDIKNLGKTYASGKVALKDVSLTFEPGTVNAVLGPSGAGKSTLLRCINGLESPTQGHVVVDGVEVTPKTLRQTRKRVGMVFQHFNLVPRLNALTNVLTGSLSRVNPLLSLAYLFPKGEVELAIQTLGKVGLTEYAWQRADRLSGGQQQRVAIARSLVQKPLVILADEPVASLDPRTSQEVMGLLVKAAREEGICLIVNLHQVDLAVEHCERIVGLKNGQLILDCAPSQLIDSQVQSLYQLN